MGMPSGKVKVSLKNGGSVGKGGGLVSAMMACRYSYSELSAELYLNKPSDSITRQ
jgi:hypothetical protein